MIITPYAKLGTAASAARKQGIRQSRTIDCIRFYRRPLHVQKSRMNTQESFRAKGALLRSRSFDTSPFTLTLLHGTSKKVKAKP